MRNDKQCVEFESSRLKGVGVSKAQVKTELVHFVITTVL